ncbi:MAG TPA: trypsin-like peptidase domain-containing protein [Thermoleophilaceae bacterium]|nr:trypsin-like peptidase domain-containing protein [Thermoleophilaceae bacterium]
MRRAAVVAAAALLVFAAGCDVNGDGEGGEEQAGRSEVTTTRVQVVEGIGREGGFDPASIYDRLAPGVVTVLSIFDGGPSLLDDEGEGGQGSGFVLDGDGFIATNAHVVTIARASRAAEAEEVYVEFSDGNRVRAEIVGHDPNADVALLKVDPEGLSLTPLRLGESESITVGEPVAAIGSPFGERQSLSIGVISALDRSIQSLTDFEIGDAIQTDAAINPGNSGGPLLDAEGRVLGINAQIKSQSGGGEGVGFAIPVDAVRRSLDELRDKGRVDYGYLGVETLTIWPQLAERMDLDADTGALVQQVVDGSPADEAGLEAGSDEINFQGQTEIATGGDLIVGVNGEDLTREHDLADEISAHSTGDRVRLELLRDGERRSIEVELGRRPAQLEP